MGNTFVGTTVVAGNNVFLVSTCIGAFSLLMSALFSVVFILLVDETANAEEIEQLNNRMGIFRAARLMNPYLLLIFFVRYKNDRKFFHSSNIRVQYRMCKYWCGSALLVVP